jgi:hypothetical protein
MYPSQLITTQFLHGLFCFSSSTELILFENCFALIPSRPPRSRRNTPAPPPPRRIFQRTSASSVVPWSSQESVLSKRESTIELACCLHRWPSSLQQQHNQNPAVVREPSRIEKRQFDRGIVVPCTQLP